MTKKKEKIVKQIFCDDFKSEDRRSAISRGLEYLENLEFHSVVFCESKRERRILFLTRHIRSLLDSFIVERGKLTLEIEQQKEKFTSEIEWHKAENLRLHQVNEQLMKNINDETLQEHNRPLVPDTYSAIFDDAGPQLKGLPFLGGLPGSKK